MTIWIICFTGPPLQHQQTQQHDLGHGAVRSIHALDQLALKPVTLSELDEANLYEVFLIQHKKVKMNMDTYSSMPRRTYWTGT